MILDPQTKLEAVLAGAITTSQPEAQVGYVLWNSDNAQTKPAPFAVALNSTADVTILAAPTNAFIAEILSVSIYNKDTASVTVIVKTDNGAEKIICRVTLLTLETLHYEKSEGWYAVDANGNRKTIAGAVNINSITGLGTGVATFLGTPSSANLAAAVTDETGTGALVFANTPTLVTPVLGAATATSINFGQTTLNYYGEGTWTPTDGSGAALTFTGVTATYTRIGRFFTADFSLSYPVTADVSQVQINGFPFTFANTASVNQGTVNFANTVAVTTMNLAINSTTAKFLTGYGTAFVTNAQLSNGILRAMAITHV